MNIISSDLKWKTTLLFDSTHTPPPTKPPIEFPTLPIHNNHQWRSILHFALQQRLDLPMLLILLVIVGHVLLAQEDGPRDEGVAP